MKRIFTLILALIMLATMSLPAAAEATVGEHGESATIVVGGYFQATGAIYKTISVDIAWDDMTFAYIKTSAGEWDPTTHEYVGGVQGEWTDETRTITVTNHSDTELTANLFFERTADVTGVFTSTGEMSSLLELDSAVRTDAANPPSASEEFGIVDGEPLEENTSLGTITVYIEAPFDTVTEGPMVHSVALSGEQVTANNSQSYAVEYYAGAHYKDVNINVYGTNLSMIDGQDNYRIGFLEPDGTVHHSEKLSDFTYNEAENCLTGLAASLRFFDGTLTLAYSFDAGETWVRLPQKLIYTMKAVVTGVDIRGWDVTEETNGSSTAYHIAVDAWRSYNTTFTIVLEGSGIDYNDYSVIVGFRKSDGTFEVKERLFTTTTVTGVNKNVDEPMQIVYSTDSGSTWIDTGDTVVYDYYWTMSGS